jgi:hypothetical protein
MIHVPIAIDTVAKDLVRHHFEIEPHIERIVWLASEGDEIRLIEITPEAIPSGMVHPFPFHPTPEVPYRTLVADVTPDEWNKIQRQEIPLPQGWSLQNYKIFERNKS